MSALTMRREAPDDLSAIRALHRAAFAGDNEARLVDELRDEGAVVLSLVAADNRRPVGHILYSRLLIDGRDAGASALAPIAVGPTHRSERVGTRLIESAHRLLAAAGERIVFVLGDPGYYLRFGFAPEAAKPFRTPYDGEYLMALKLAREAPSSGTVTYAAPFARLG